MFDVTGIPEHPAIQELTDLLCAKTQNADRSFFKVEAAYFLATMASSMRATVVTKDRGEIPVNLYALLLNTSGAGKGHSIGIMEREIIAGFKAKFMQSTLPEIAEDSLWERAQNRASIRGSSEEEEYDVLLHEYQAKGPYVFAFDSGTSPAVKQMREKLILSGIGAINYMVDEIGSNLIGSTELLNLFLELYDQGVAKQKLTKQTSDNQRGEDLDGKTPSNMLLFGTPVRLLDGGNTEDTFYNFLETGYARRCVFALGSVDKRAYHSMSPQEIYAKLIDPKNNELIQKWSSKFASLAEKDKYRWRIDVSDEVAIKLLEYRIDCEKEAETLPEHEEIRKAELSHRYFKALKLAGALAFVDSNRNLPMQTLLQAIRFVEESGKAFQSILMREKPYAKLAKYLASVESEVTHADLNEALPFYKIGQSARNELMTLAQAWGIKNSIIIKKSYVDGIEFFKGETLKKTDLNKMIVSYSNHFAYDYISEPAPWNELTLLTQAEGLHWANHKFLEGHRCEEKVIPGFNMVVLDADGSVPIKTVQDILKDYKFLLYTTKRHTEQENRFRLIMPINYVLELDSEDYKEFMNNIMNWLPFETDASANQRAKKWESCSKGTYIYNDGMILDVLQFIPRTNRNEQYKEKYKEIENLSNLERWFASKISEGNRNNNMIKYALALVDAGMSFPEVEDRVLRFNKKLKFPLPEAELKNTVLVTTAKKYEH